MKEFTIFALSALFVLAMAAAGLSSEGHHHPMDGKDVAPKFFDSPQKAGVQATCPVLGTTFTIDENTQHSEYKGKYAYFCCVECKPLFDADPEKYLKQK